MSPETKQSWSAPALGSAPVATQERYGSGLAGGYRSGSADGPDPEPRNGTRYEPAPDKPRLPSLDLAAPPEPDFPSESWLESPSGTLADHPLLRGLLLELPPKGSTPPPGWLDRWFEATRSILELLYVHEASRR
jgi:hypothetical protein